MIFLIQIISHELNAQKNHPQAAPPHYGHYAPILTGMVSNQWEFQDPKMELLYHIRPYFAGIVPYIGLIKALYMVGTSILGSWNGHWSKDHEVNGAVQPEVLQELLKSLGIGAFWPKVAFRKVGLVMRGIRGW